MRVHYVGNFRAPHSTENEVRKALEHRGHDVLPVQEDIAPWRELATSARAQGADLVLWTHTHGYADESRHDECWYFVRRCADLGIPTVSYHLDRWWGLERQAQAEHEPFFRTSLVITADGGHQGSWAEAGVNHRWLPPAISHHELGRGEYREGFASDVAFVGGWGNYGHAGVWPWRKKLIHHLQQHWGDRLQLWPHEGQPAVRGPALRDLYASTRVVVGDSCLAGGATHYWSDRLPETIGRGGYLLHPEVDGLDQWWAGCCLPATFPLGDLDAVDALIEQGLGLSDHERQLATAEGIDFVSEFHTYVHRVRQLEIWMEAGL